jgi:hypothetical protein
VGAYIGGVSASLLADAAPRSERRTGFIMAKAGPWQRNVTWPCSGWPIASAGVSGGRARAGKKMALVRAVAILCTYVVSIGMQVYIDFLLHIPVLISSCAYIRYVALRMPYTYIWRLSGPRAASATLLSRATASVPAPGPGRSRRCACQYRSRCVQQGRSRRWRPWQLPPSQRATAWCMAMQQRASVRAPEQQQR